MVTTKSLVYIFINIIILASIIGYLIPLPGIEVGGKLLRFYLYEIVILVSFLLGVRKFCITMLDISIIVWMGLVGFVVLFQGLLYIVPQDIWMRSLLYTFKWGIAFLAYFIGRNNPLTESQKEILKKITIFSIILLSAVITVIQIKIYNIGSFSQMLRFRLGYFESFPGIFSAINPNQIGQLLALALAGLTSSEEKGTRGKILILGTSFLLLLTFSREAILTILIFFLLNIKTKKTWNSILIFGAILVIIAFFAFFVPEGLYSAGKERILSFINPGQAIITARVNVAWKPLIEEVIIINPIFGVGPDGLRYFSSTVSDVIVYNGDNIILGTMAAFGIIGLLGLVLFISSMILVVIKANQRYNDRLCFMHKYILSYCVTGLIAPHFLWPYNSINALVLLLFGLSLSTDLCKANKF